MGAPAFFETAPPPWAARGLAHLLVGLFVTAAVIASVLQIPETVSCPFVLVPGKGAGPGDAPLQAELSVSQSGVGRLKPGQGVKLLYDAFPYQRYGIRRATLRWIGPSGTGADPRPAFRALADVHDQAIWAESEARPLRPGMTGTAKIVLGRRSVFSYALEPIRQLRENLAPPPPAPAGPKSNP